MRCFLQIVYLLPCLLGVYYLTPCTLANITTHIDNENFISQVDLAKVHGIKHFLRAWLTNLIVTGMSEQTNANDNASFERQMFLGLHELLLEAGAPTECDYLVVLYH